MDKRVRGSFVALGYSIYWDMEWRRWTILAASFLSCTGGPCSPSNFLLLLCFLHPTVRHLIL